MKALLPTGNLRHRVVLEAPVRTPDGGGGSVVGWTPVAEVWAEIRTGQGQEAMIAEALSGRVSHVVTIRYRDGVDHTMRLRFGGRLFAITAVVDHDEGHRFLACYCREQDL